MFVRVGPVAQRLEQRTHNPLVLGSNPSGPTNLSAQFPFLSRGPARTERAGPLVNMSDWCLYPTMPGLSAPPVVGLRNKVIEMNAPTHEPEAAKPTYIQFFV
jgi:hypothetical protein